MAIVDICAYIPQAQELFKPFCGRIAVVVKSEATHAGSFFKSSVQPGLHCYACTPQDKGILQELVPRIKTLIQTRYIKRNLCDFQRKLRNSSHLLILDSLTMGRVSLYNTTILKELQMLYCLENFLHFLTVATGGGLRNCFFIIIINHLAKIYAKSRVSSVILQDTLRTPS